MSIDSYFCFCCLSTENLNNLFSDTTDAKSSYVDIIYELCGVKPCPELKDDSYICEECSNKLNIIWEFKEQVKETVNILQINGLLQLRKIKGELLLTKLTDDVDNKKSEEYVKLLKNKNIDVKLIKTETEPVTKTKPFSKREQDTKTEKILPRLIKIGPRQYAKLDEEETNQNLPKLVKIEPGQHAKLNEEEAANRKFECPECYAVLPNSYSYHQHMNTHFPNEICDVCGKGFISKSKLKRHRATHDDGPFKCKRCDAVFNKKNTMYCHMKTHNNQPTYKCPFCLIRLETYIQRMEHIVSEHNQPSDRHKCHLCGEGFPMNGQLINHLSSVHKVRKLRHRCSVCGRKFCKRTDLEAHLSRHTGDYPHRCDICGKKFAAKKTLKGHMLSHLTEKPYNCAHCGKGFVYKYNLGTHLKRNACKRHLIQTEEELVSENKEDIMSDNSSIAWEILS